MNYDIAEQERCQIGISFSTMHGIGVLNSFIPPRFAIGIRSTYIFQCTSFLKYEFHELNKKPICKLQYEFLYY